MDLVASAINNIKNKAGQLFGGAEQAIQQNPVGNFMQGTIGNAAQNFINPARSFTQPAIDASNFIGNTLGQFNNPVTQFGSRFATGIGQQIQGVQDTPIQLGRTALADIQNPSQIPSQVGGLARGFIEGPNKLLGQPLQLNSNNPIGFGVNGLQMPNPQKSLQYINQDPAGALMSGIGLGMGVSGLAKGGIELQGAVSRNALDGKAFQFANDVKQNIPQEGKIDFSAEIGPRKTQVGKQTEVLPQSDLKAPLGTSTTKNDSSALSQSRTKQQILDQQVNTSSSSIPQQVNRQGIVNNIISEEQQLNPLARGAQAGLYDTRSPIFDNLAKGDLQLYGKDTANIGRGYFGGESGTGIELAKNAPKELNQVGVLGQASKSIQVRRDARRVSYLLSDKVPDNTRITRLQELSQNLESKGTPEGKVIENAINKLTGRVAEQPLSDTIAKLDNKTYVKSQKAIKARVQGQTELGRSVGQPNASEKASIAQAEKLFGNTTEKDFGITKKTATNDGVPLADLSKKKGPAPIGQTRAKVELPINGVSEKERVQSAIANHEYVKNSLLTTGKDAYIAGLKLDRHDLRLSEQFEQGKPISQLAQSAHDHDAFIEYMRKSNDYYDKRLATDRAIGGLTSKREYYMPHNWDLSNPKDLERFNQFARQKGLQPWDGYRSQPRVFDTYAQGEAKGFKRKFPNTLEDLKNDYQGSSEVLAKKALQNGLAEAAPDKVSTAGKGFTEDNKPFINSNIKNLEGMSYHPDIHKMLKGFTPRSDTDLFKAVKEVGLSEGLKKTGAKDTILSLYDHATTPMKHFLLNLSAFHDINIGMGYAGKSLTNPIKGTRGLVQSVGNTFSEKTTQLTIKYFKNKQVNGKDYSVFEAGLRAGVNMDRGLPATVKQKLNPLGAVGRSTFDRTLYTWKLNLVDMAYGNGKIDPRSPMGREVGKEINKVIGEMNNRTMNIDPNTQKWLSRALLAPQFTESKYSLLADAATKRGAAGNFARKAVIGKTIVAGSIATFGTVLATGQFPALQQLLLNYTVAPDIQTNLTNPKGKKQDISLPQTYLSEPLRPIVKSIQDQSADPLINYGQARLNPLISNGEKLLTNQDYYGNPIRDDTASVTDQAKQAAVGIGTGMLPIGAQNVANVAEGKMNPTQAAINAIGLRTHTSSQDPSVKYATTASRFESSLPQDQQKAMDAYKSITSQLQMNPNDYNLTMAKYRLLAANSQLAANVVKQDILTAQAVNGMPNPITSYDPMQQKIIYSVESLPPDDAYAKQLKNGNPELFADYYAKMATYSAYLDKQNIQPKAGAEQYINGPKPSDYDPQGKTGYVQSMLDAATKAKAAGMKTAAYYNDPAVAQYMLASRTFQNTKLAQEGYNQLDKYGNILPANTQLALTALGTNPASFISGGSGYGSSFRPGMPRSPISQLRSRLKSQQNSKLTRGMRAKVKKTKLTSSKPAKLKGLSKSSGKAKLAQVSVGKGLTTSKKGIVV